MGHENQICLENEILQTPMRVNSQQSNQTTRSTDPGPYVFHTKICLYVTSSIPQKYYDLSPGKKKHKRLPRKKKLVKKAKGEDEEEIIQCNSAA